MLNFSVSYRLYLFQDSTLVYSKLGLSPISPLCWLYNPFTNITQSMPQVLASSSNRYSRSCQSVYRYTPPLSLLRRFQTHTSVLAKHHSLRPFLPPICRHHWVWLWSGHWRRLWELFCRPQFQFGIRKEILIMLKKILQMHPNQERENMLSCFFFAMAFTYLNIHILVSSAKKNLRSLRSSSTTSVSLTSKIMHARLPWLKKELELKKVQQL